MREFHVFDNAERVLRVRVRLGSDSLGGVQVREIGDSEGNITIRHSNYYEKMRLVGNNTVVSGRGESFGAESIRRNPVNVFDGLKRATIAHSLSALGLRDNISGGPVSLNSAFINHPFIRLETGRTAGNTAVMNLGDGALKSRSFPKVAFAMNPPDQQSDASNSSFVSDSSEIRGHDSGRTAREQVDGGEFR